MLKLLMRWLLGPAAEAGRQVLDQEARLAAPPRALPDPAVDRMFASPRGKVYQRSWPPLMVIEGGRASAPAETPASEHGRRAAS